MNSKILFTTTLLSLAFSGCYLTKTIPTPKAFTSDNYKAFLEKCNVSSFSENFVCSNKNIIDSDVDKISFVHFSDFKEINLSGNKLTKIPEGISSLSNLRKLNLSNNNIEYPVEPLDNMIRLEELNLSSNNMKIFNADIINRIKVKKLNLSSNQLEYLSEDVFTDRIVNIRDNHIER